MPAISQRLFFYGLSLLSLIFALPSRAQTALDYLQTATNQEAKVITGKVKLRVFTITIPLTSVEENTLQQQGSLSLSLREKLTKTAKTIDEFTFTFDNEKNKIKQEGHLQPGNIPHLSVSSEKSICVFNKDGREKGRSYVDIYPPMWPPGWPDTLWRSRVAAGRLRVVKSGDPVATLNSKEQNGEVLLNLDVVDPKFTTNQRIIVTTQELPVFRSLQLFDRKTGHKAEENKIYWKMPLEGTTYPSLLLTTSYYTSDGKPPKISQQQITEVLEANLNLPLNEQDFEFGKIPDNAGVQDNRFGKPIAYTQGKHQFTDEELFAAAKDPTLLERLEMGAGIETSSTSKPLNYLLPLGGLALLGTLGAAVWNRRRNA